MNIIEFNEDTLCCYTPLKKGTQSINIMSLINPNNSDLIEKIINEVISFKPVNTYFDRLYESIVKSEI